MPTTTITIGQQMLDIAASVFDAYSVLLFLPEDGVGPAATLAASFSLGGGVIPGARVEPGQGLVGWILRSRQPLMVPAFDQQHSSLDYYAKDEEAGIRAFMGCPLPSGGALCVDTKARDAFTEKDHRVLQLFAAAMDAQRRSGGAQAALGDIPNYFAALGAIEDLRYSHRNWSAYIAGFLDTVAAATGFSYCSFASVNVPGESYCIEAENQPLLLKGGERFFQAMGNGLAGWVFRNGQPVVHGGEDGRAPALFGTSANLPEFAAVACLPVTVSQEVRGVISLGHSVPRGVDETMRSFLDQAVGHLSLYLENMFLRARLRGLIRAQAGREEG